MAWPAKVPTTTTASAGNAARRIIPRRRFPLPISIQNQKVGWESRRFASNLAFQRRAAGKASRIAELLLNAQQLVIFGGAVGPGEAAGLDLAAGERDREVGDGRILGLARPVRHHRRIAR